MSIKLRELFTRIGFDINDKPLKQLDAGIKQVRNTILAMSGAVVAAGGALVGLAVNVAHVGDNARKTAQALGLTTEAYQELEYVASIGGMKQEEVSTALRQLSNTAMDASLGLETYKRVYDALGISVTDATGKLKNVDVLIPEIADRFSQMEDGATKTAYAYDLFGRSGTRLIPTLNGGAAGIAKLRQEAIKSAYVMSDESARASEEFNDSITITRLMAVIRGIKNQIGMGLIPTFTDLIKQAKDWILRNREIIRLKLDQVIKALVRYITLLYGIARKVAIVIKSLADAFGGLEKVIRYATYALMGFLALKFIYGIGAIAQGIWGLVAGFTALGTAGMLASVKALALPLLIGVAIAALILGIQDVISFFQGKDSITGLIVDAFKKKYPEAIEATKKALQGVLDLFKEVAKQVFTKPGTMVSEIGGQVSRATGRAYPEEGSWWDKMKFFAKSIQFGHTNIPPSVYRTNSPNISLHAPINLTFNNAGPMDEKQVGETVRGQIEGVLDEKLRTTYRATSPQVEY